MHLQAHAREVVLCHADIHAGNLHLTPDGSLYIVDWDNPLFAPKEKDLALVGGCGTWRNPRQTALFYRGYGEAPIDRTALAYYRYERIIQDVAEFGKQLFLSPDGGANRPQSLAWCMGLFEAGNDVELAIKNDVDLI